MDHFIIQIASYILKIRSLSIKEKIQEKKLQNPEQGTRVIPEQGAQRIGDVAQ